jgi:diguanylate cyclase (GGDEF)-like protein
MKHYTYLVENPSGLTEFLASKEIITEVAKAKSILVQIFSAQTVPAWLKCISEIIADNLPTAVLVGSTTVGEIIDGRTFVKSTVVSFSFFEFTTLVPLFAECHENDEEIAGHTLGSEISSSGSDIAGVLLLATPISINVTELLNGLANKVGNYPVFGGGAADYGAMHNSLILLGTQLLNKGAVAVVFLGNELHIDIYSYLGWLPLSKEMTITEAHGKFVKTVDDEPAFNVYHRYLNISNDVNFDLDVLAFPFLVERDGQTLARVPISVEEDGSLQFVADVRIGEKFKVGYGNPTTIIHDAKEIQAIMRAFMPDAVFLYTCGCRRFLMQEEVELETLPFQEIAPTVGFYTYGEFFGQSNNLHLLNSAMVAVGMREGQHARRTTYPKKQWADVQISQVDDPYVNKHIRVISHLMHFINVVTSELEQVNSELELLSITDKLTQIYNRVKLDNVLNHEIDYANRYRTDFSVILIDIDHFKQVNDVHGHNTGDAVLIFMAQILKENIRNSDILGRWGGEEFLIILPQTTAKQAFDLAEKIRKTVESAKFPVVNHKTISVGVTQYCSDDSVIELIERADRGLYDAKNTGRNKVVLVTDNLDKT